MDFTLTEEQLALKRMVKEFVEKEVKPFVAEYDRALDPAKTFPREIIRKASKLGLRTLCLPEQHGGGGANHVTTCVVFEELAAGERGIAGTLFQTNKLSRFLASEELTTEDQRDRFIPEFVRDDLYLLAAGLNEPVGGSDNMLPFSHPSAGPRCTAIKDGDGRYYILNGDKHFTANGGVAKLYFIFARTDKTKGLLDGVSCFLVPHDTPGFTIGRVHDKMGNRLLQNTELIFQNARVPVENMVGEEHKGVPVIRALLKGSGIGTSATILGPARAAYEAALEYAQERVQGGRPIIEHQAIGMMLADMYIMIEAARNCIYKAAWSADHPEHFDPKLSIMTKVFTSEIAFRVAVMAMEIFGGMGYMKDVGVEKYVRDAAGAFHIDGTNQVGRIKAARVMAGKGAPRAEEDEVLVAG